MYFFYFYPLGLDLRTRRRPVLSIFIAAVMVVAFIWSRYFSDLLPLNPYALVFYPGNNAPWTAVTAMFMHAGWLHLVGNLIYFQVFAPPLEDRLGPGRFLLFLLMMGVFGNLVHGLVSTLGWLGQAGVGVLGASGAIAGFLAFSLVRLQGSKVQVAWWVFAPLVGQNRAGRAPVPLAAAVGLWLLLQVVYTLVASETGAQVSFGAHLGGFVMGLFLALAMGQMHEGRADARKRKADRYFELGHYHAAIGEWTEYLDLRPVCRDGKMGLARCLQLIGQTVDARRHFQDVFQGWLNDGQMDQALNIFAEASRSSGLGCFGRENLARVAYYREKQLDFQGAVKAYEQLYQMWPHTSTAHRALVRVVLLYEGKLNDSVKAQQWREVAETDLPDEGWRDFLVNPRSVDRADAEADPWAPDRVSTP